VKKSLEDTLLVVLMLEVVVLMPVLLVFIAVHW